MTSSHRNGSSISVIVPVFNRESFIEECLESILAQSVSDYELIVVDDGSTDQTPSKLSRFKEKITVITQKQQGPSAARNAGIEHASGEWLSFLDSDDLWLPSKLEKQLKFLAVETDCKICYTEEIWFRHGRRVNPGKKHQKYSGWIYPRLLPLCIISPSSVIIHRSVLETVGRFDADLPACEDYDLWLRIGAHYPISLIPAHLIIKRNGHPGQQSQKFWGMDRFRVISLVKMIKSGVLSPEYEAATQKVLFKKCNILIQGHEKRGKLDEAAHYRKIMEAYCL